jgi:sulfide:quinone oxidoreductase
MELHRITEDLTVASQLDAAAVPLVAAKGFRALICNRPDGEASGQPAFGRLASSKTSFRLFRCQRFTGYALETS